MMNNDVTETINMTIGSTTENINFGIEGNENINFNIESSTGTSDYNRLLNKPKINSVELIDNKTSDELGLQEKGDYANTRVTNIEIDNLFR